MTPKIWIHKKLQVMKGDEQVHMCACFKRVNSIDNLNNEK